jgi:Domain of unknown function (DUF4148)
MNFTRTFGSLLLFAAFGTHANAQLTREQVKAELAEAMRTGDLPADADSDADNLAGTADSVNKSAESVHLNLIWSPLAQTNFGLEYIHARCETHNGDTGRLNRLQAAAQHLF